MAKFLWSGCEPTKNSDLFYPSSDEQIREGCPETMGPKAGVAGTNETTSLTMKSEPSLGLASINHM